MPTTPLDVQLLYFRDCPNWQATLEDLRAVLADASQTSAVHLIEVRSNRQAQQLRFTGSPTVRVNGRDVEPGGAPEQYNLECRLYWVGGRAAGRPPREWLAEAIRLAQG